MTPANISGPNGVWNPATRKISWWASSASAAELGYTVSGSPGVYEVSGMVSFDGGTDQPVSGDALITIGEEPSENKGFLPAIYRLLLDQD